MQRTSVSDCNDINGEGLFFKFRVCIFITFSLVPEDGICLLLIECSCIVGATKRLY